MTAAARLVIRGQVVLAARPSGLETAEAIAIADGRVLAAGSWDDVRRSAGAATRVLDVRDAAVVPGLHDFHIHLVGLARSRLAVRLDGARDAAEVAERLARAAAGTPPDGWITGRGWTEAQLAAGVEALQSAVRERPAFLSSHDGHSAWASAAARRLAGLGPTTPDPAGGRIERDESGQPTGILRETALDIVAVHVARIQGEALRLPLDDTLRDLAALGVTGASEAGDYTDQNGTGTDAAFGDSYSSLTDVGDLVDGRLRLTLGIPADALAAGAERGLHTGAALAGRRTLRFGWAKEYADGALGSGTAALLEPATCGDLGTGILRVSGTGFDDLFAAARPAGIGMAIHAIGDRAAREVLDAMARARPRLRGVPPDRVEHVQLVHPSDATRFAGLGAIASVQPIHAAADRDLVESCWDGRQDGAYAWRALVAAGSLLAAGSDAPVESANPWLGIFAAVHRRLPGDGRDDWRPAQALTLAEALSAYTLGPAMAIGATDEGHLGVGGRADLSVLSVSLDTLLAADERLGDVRSALTLVDGDEVASA
jgi:predicted amidohydrolase YtcJ